MRILVTGATGNVGAVVVEQLKQAGADVHAAVRDPESDRARALGVHAVEFDYSEPEAMAAAMRGFDRLFLLLPLDQDMRKWGANAVAAAKAAGISLVVRSSGMGADPNAHFQLGKVHGAVDADLDESKVPFVVLRPATFMQNYVTLLGPAIKATGKISVPEADARTSFVDLRDVGAAAAGVLADPDPTLNAYYVVTGPEALTNHQLAEHMSRATGREILYEPAEVEEYGLALERAGVPEWNIHMILSVHRYARSDYTSFKTSAVEHLSGRPANDFASFAAEFAPAWKPEA